MRLDMSAGRAADRFRLDAFEPAYVALQRDGKLGARAASAFPALASCREPSRSTGSTGGSR
jgi:hypothetical protein